MLHWAKLCAYSEAPFLLEIVLIKRFHEFGNQKHFLFGYIFPWQNVFKINIKMVSFCESFDFYVVMIFLLKNI